MSPAEDINSIVSTESVSPPQLLTLYTEDSYATTTQAPSEYTEHTTTSQQNLLQLPSSVISVLIVLLLLSAFVLLPCFFYRLVCKRKSISSCFCVKKNTSLYEDPFNVNETVDDVTSDNKSWNGAGSSITSGIDCSSQGSVLSQSLPPLIKRSYSQPSNKSTSSRFVVLLIDESSSPPRHVLRLKTRASQLDSIEESIQSANSQRRRHTIAKLRSNKLKAFRNLPGEQLSSASDEISHPSRDIKLKSGDLGLPFEINQYNTSSESATNLSASESLLSDTKLEMA